MQSETFKLIGLNKTWKAAGFDSIYATVEYGKEDWFHAEFDKENFTDATLAELFDLFKNSEENLWSKRNHKVVVQFKSKPSSGPTNPSIKEVHLDNIEDDFLKIK